MGAVRRRRPERVGRRCLGRESRRESASPLRRGRNLGNVGGGHDEFPIGAAALVGHRLDTHRFLAAGVAGRLGGLGVSMARLGGQQAETRPQGSQDERKGRDPDDGFAVGSETYHAVKYAHAADSRQGCECTRAFFCIERRPTIRAQ